MLAVCFSAYLPAIKAGFFMSHLCFARHARCSFKALTVVRGAALGAKGRESFVSRNTSNDTNDTHAPRDIHVLRSIYCCSANRLLHTSDESSGVQPVSLGVS